MLPRPPGAAAPQCHLAPLTREVIFGKAMSRATSGESCFGFPSMLKGEKPQSSVEPLRSLGMYFEARQPTVAHLRGCFHARIQRIDYTNETYLRNPVRIGLAVLPAQLVDFSGSQATSRE